MGDTIARYSGWAHVTAYEREPGVVAVAGDERDEVERMMVDCQFGNAALPRTNKHSDCDPPDCLGLLKRAVLWAKDTT